LKIPILIISLFALLHSCERNLEGKINEPTLGEIHNILETSLKNRNEDIRKKEREIINDLQKAVKMKYAFLNQSAGKVIVEYEKFYKKKDILISELGLTPNLEEKKSSLIKIKENLKQTDSIVLAMFNYNLKNHFHIIGLKEYEMENRLESQKQYLLNIEKKNPFIIEDEIENDHLFKIKHLSIQFIATQKERHFIKSFRELTGSKFYETNSIMPIILSPNKCIKQGDVVEFEIGLGTFYHNFNIDKTKLVVNNNDTLSINENGKFIYKIKANKKGLMKLDTKSLVYNPLIDDYYVNFSYWEYIVE
jgi:hypothetical protein